ncbi:MAG: RtcB family protein [Planctomycetaceae bacterium]
MTAMTAPVRRWLCGRIDDGLVRQIDRLGRQPDVVAVAVMPDVHQGRVVPNGVAVATRRLVYPDLVGADIGCGIAALRFTVGADVARDRLEGLLERLPGAVPTLKQPVDRAARHRPLVEGLGAPSAPRLARAADRDGVYQLGTLGRGNHFLELAGDDEGALWGVVHTGSRALGQEITAFHRAPGADGPGASADELPALDLDGAAGRAYFADMEWACRYAAANRAAILNALADLVEELIGGTVDTGSFVDSPHNTATREQVGGETLVVHRKSANAAAAGRRGVVAGSMATGSRMTIGLGSDAALHSSAHGAGRVMSRTEAMGRFATRDLEGRMHGVVYHRAWARRFRDEAPQAYRDLHEVMRAQRDLVKTERVLTPILNDKRP